MKNKILTISFFFMSTLFLTAQKNMFWDVEARTTYMGKSGFENSRDFEIYGENLIAFNTIERVKLNLKHEDEKVYKPYLGFELFINLNIELTKKMSIRTGVGASLLQFSANRKFLGSQRTILGVDTITSSDTFITLKCDDTLNQFPDLVPLGRMEHYDIISLRVPIMLTYRFLNSKADLGIGGYIKTPIFNRFKTEYFVARPVQSEFFPAHEECRYETEDVEENFGRNIKSLGFGCSISLGYRIIQNLNLQLSLLQDVTNVFQDPKVTSLMDPVNHLVPSRIALGLRYAFVSSKIEE